MAVVIGIGRDGSERRLNVILMCCCLVLVLLLSGCGGSKVEGLYVAHTADGVQIKMRRYRPSPDADYSAGTPVVLFPGITLNNNQFHIYSPPWLNSYHYRLPADAPDWALNDPVIQEDNLKLFSLAHYLYRQGYDVWMPTYRGVGKGGYDSEHGHANTNLDVWCALDVPAAIEKVIGVTGKKPIIGGHSTGGLCSYLYLQGVTMDAAVVAAGEYLPHVTSSEALALQRNQQVLGFLGLDPAGIPFYPYSQLLDNENTFASLGRDALVDLDASLPWVMSVLPPIIVSGALDLTFKTITALADAFPKWLPDWANLFGGIDFWHTANMNGYVEDFHARMVISSFYMGVTAQYSDWAINGVFREHWQNGAENVDLVMPPDRVPEDGYYYYSDNMSRMTVPAFSVFSDSSALVDTDTMVGLLYESKTAHPLDDWIEVPGTAHIDVVNGNQAPTVSFPAIAEWLNSL